MKAIEFPQQTLILAKDQPEYANLPVFISNDNQKQMISCHELDDSELALINKTKRIWQSQLTFGQHYHPSWLAVENPFDVHPKESTCSNAEIPPVDEFVGCDGKPHSDQFLKELLDDAIKDEKYELASRIKEEFIRRDKDNDHVANDQDKPIQMSKEKMIQLLKDFANWSNVNMIEMDELELYGEEFLKETIKGWKQ